MKRSRKVIQAIPIPEKNSAKYFSYREAWSRIQKARGYGFYFEAVTLEESIISDRLISFLLHVGAIEPDARLDKYSFGQLIRIWSELVAEPISTEWFSDLRKAVDEWRRRRNKIVHGIVKSAPGVDSLDVLDFVKEAELVAFQGDALARAITDWCRRQKRQQRKLTGKC